MNPADTKPEKPGVYRVSPPISSIPQTPTPFYAYWTGRAWCPAVTDRAETNDARYRKRRAHVQSKRWKELAP